MSGNRRSLLVVVVNCFFLLLLCGLHPSCLGPQAQRKAKQQGEGSRSGLSIYYTCMQGLLKKSKISALGTQQRHSQPHQHGAHVTTWPFLIMWHIPWMNILLYTYYIRMHACMYHVLNFQKPCPLMMWSSCHVFF